jgi:hypothetical protein
VAGAVAVVKVAIVVDTGPVKLVDEGEVLPAEVEDKFVVGSNVEVVGAVGTTDVWPGVVAVDVTVTLDLNCGTELTAPGIKVGPGTG